MNPYLKHSIYWFTASILIVWLSGCTPTISGVIVKDVLSKYTSDVRYVDEQTDYKLISADEVYTILKHTPELKNKYDPVTNNCRHHATYAKNAVLRIHPNSAYGILKLTNTHKGVKDRGGWGVRMDNHMMVWFFDHDLQLNIMEPQKYWQAPVRGKKLESFKPILYISK